MQSRIYTTPTFQFQDKIEVISAIIDSRKTLIKIEDICKDTGKKLQPYFIDYTEEMEELYVECLQRNPPVIYQPIIYMNVDKGKALDTIFKYNECTYYNNNYFYSARKLKLKEETVWELEYLNGDFYLKLSY